MIYLRLGDLSPRCSIHIFGGFMYIRFMLIWLLILFFASIFVLLNPPSIRNFLLFSAP